MRKDTESFILSSEYDLTTARHMFNTGRYVYVVFMCHIAIEKLLKAIVAETTDRVPPRTHNLLYLGKLANINMPQDLFDFIAKINNASVVTRYPEDFSQLIESYPENIVKEYLENTEKVLTWLKQNKKFLK
jgi:HEPN domain-containing protein